MADFLFFRRPPSSNWSIDVVLLAAIHLCSKEVNSFIHCFGAIRLQIFSLFGGERVCGMFPGKRVYGIDNSCASVSGNGKPHVLNN